MWVWRRADCERSVGVVVVSRDVTDLVGRVAQKAAIGAALAALPGAGSCLHVTGPAGIGKSALLAHGRARARLGGLTVVQARGVEAVRGLAFSALHELLRPVLPFVGRLPTTQREALLDALGAGRAVHPPERFRVGLAALELLAESACVTPVLAVVDDLQWVDTASREVIAFVSRRLTSEPLVLIAASRTSEVAGDCGGLGEGTQLLPLDPLTEDDASTLLATRAGHLDRSQRRRVLDLAQGNPLALIELPTTPAGEPNDPRERARPDAAALTSRLLRTFADRLEDCTPPTRTLLLLAALQDSDDLTLAHAVAVDLLGAEAADRALAEAFAIALAEPDPDNPGQLRLRHPLVRSALIEAAGPAELAAAHLALAARLENPDRAVWHRAAAIQDPDEKVAADLDTAASHAAARGATSLALACLQRAAALSLEPAGSARRLMRAAEYAFELGHPDTVRELTGHLRALPADRVDTGRLAALESAFDDGVPDGQPLVRDLTRAAVDATAGGDRALASHLLIRAARATYWGAYRDPDLAPGLRAATDRVGLPTTDARILLIGSFVDPFTHGPTVIAQLEHPDARDPVDIGLLAQAAFVAGAFDHTVHLTGLAADALREQGSLAALAQVQVLRSFAALYLGQWQVCYTASDEAHRYATETGQRTWAACADLAKANLAATRGRQRLAARLTNGVLDVAADTGNVAILNGIQLNRGLAALGQGDAATAFTELSRMVDPRDPAYQSPQCAWAMDYYAEAAALTGHHRQAREVLARIEDLTADTPADGVRRALALAHALLADDDHADQAFDTAHRRTADASPWYRARLDLAHGHRLRRHRLITRAREHLRSAQRVFDALDAPAWGARADDELRATGQRAQRHRPDAWASLSPQELEIARLAGEGLSNREIGERLYLSHRTVGSHLYRMFPKLGIRSRSQLAYTLGRS
ncbi:AAA family ATPase [Kitasatospora sp. NPDC094015]|uniref:helix-turn-helix transcriptional regulator n=1 Tax=Kitasatospora sp. NPDC094015 TaxID=3155205 RepID=UPI003329DE29